MVRSYYPSECHADYFDFERIEALKPAIEACGISTLSQSPMLGFNKQMDNRIKLLKEILTFRMQGVEFDNGDMDVDGHKAASDVRFFSSRRRHKILQGDWSSDVCSSDLASAGSSRSPRSRAASASAGRPSSRALLARPSNVVRQSARAVSSVRARGRSFSRTPAYSA